MNDRQQRSIKCIFDNILRCIIAIAVAIVAFGIHGLLDISGVVFGASIASGLLALAAIIGNVVDAWINIRNFGEIPC